MTNKTQHLSSITNKEIGASSLLVQDANFLVSEAEGFVGSPYGISNKAQHLSSLTNKSSS